MTAELSVKTMILGALEQDNEEKEVPTEAKPWSPARISELNLQLKQTFGSIIRLEEYPKSEITLSFEVIKPRGSLYSWIVNTASVALLLSGIKLMDTFGSMACVNQLTWVANDCFRL
jgi:ribonuclease PH